MLLFASRAAADGVDALLLVGRTSGFAGTLSGIQALLLGAIHCCWKHMTLLVVLVELSSERKE